MATELGGGLLTPRRWLNEWRSLCWAPWSTVVKQKDFFKKLFENIYYNGVSIKVHINVKNKKTFRHFNTFNLGSGGVKQERFLVATPIHHDMVYVWRNKIKFFYP